MQICVPDIARTNPGMFAYQTLYILQRFHLKMRSPNKGIQVPQIQNHSKRIEFFFRDQKDVAKETSGSKAESGTMHLEASKFFILSSTNLTCCSVILISCGHLVCTGLETKGMVIPCATAFNTKTISSYFSPMLYKFLHSTAQRKSYARGGP